MNNKNKNFAKCDFCKSPAVANFQKVWVKFNINKKGEYKKDKTFDTFDFSEPINKDNIHLCKKDIEKWINEEI